MRNALFLPLLLLCTGIHAQDSSSVTLRPSVSDAIHLGPGIGLDHGVIGLRVDVPVTRRVAVLAGAGHALAGPAWNIGTQYRFLPDGRIGPYATALYGTNGVIRVVGDSRHDDVYTGFTAGAGVEFRVVHSASFFRMAVLVPFRSKAFWDDHDALRHDRAVELRQAPAPVTFSAGFHFAL